MTTTAKKPNQKQVVTACTPSVNTLLLAMTLAQAERERVDAIKARILADTIYLGQQHFDGRDDQSLTRITDVKRDWMIQDSQSAGYYKACDEAYRAAGFEGPEGHCPALIAESLQVDAERLLIDTAAPFFGITNDNIWNVKNSMAQRQKYLDLLIGLCVNAPGYVAPKIPTAA